MLTNEQKKELREMSKERKRLYNCGLSSLEECIRYTHDEWNEKHDSFDSCELWTICWDRDKEAYVAKYLLRRER